MTAGEKKEVWIGLVWVKPRPGNVLLNQAPGAYTNVLALASNSSEYLDAVRLALDEIEFDVIDVEEVEPLRIRKSSHEIDVSLEKIAEEVRKTGNTGFGTFHAYKNETTDS